MSEMDRLERDLVARFAQTGAPPTPDYTHESLARVAVTRQRPHWSFPGMTSIDGGPCRGSLFYDGSWHEGVLWSPDDRWIVAHPGMEQPARQCSSILRPDASKPRHGSRQAPKSWQRLAP